MRRLKAALATWVCSSAPGFTSYTKMDTGLPVAWGRTQRPGLWGTGCPLYPAWVSPAPRQGPQNGRKGPLGRSLPRSAPQGLSRVPRDPRPVRRRSLCPSARHVGTARPPPRPVAPEPRSPRQAGRDAAGPAARTRRGRGRPRPAERGPTSPSCGRGAGPRAPVGCPRGDPG